MGSNATSSPIMQIQRFVLDDRYQGYPDYPGYGKKKIEKPLSGWRKVVHGFTPK